MFYDKANQFIYYYFCTNTTFLGGPLIPDVQVMLLGGHII